MSRAISIILIVALFAVSALRSLASNKDSKDERHTTPLARLKTDATPAARAYVKALFETWDMYPVSRPWPQVVARTQAAAKRLAEAQGKGIVPVLKKYGPAGESQMLALLTLDELQLREEASQFACQWFFADSYCGEVLLPAASCSRPMREAIANALLRQWANGARPVVPLLESFPEYLSVMGNAETADLLRSYDKEIAKRTDASKGNSEKESAGASPRPERREKQSRNAFALAAERITARLALPKKAAARRGRDALLFWQTVWYTPRTPAPNDYRSSARSLVAGGYRISSDFLIELFESKNRPAFLDPDVAIEIVLAQREYGAIPAMVGLAKREPKYRERVERAIREIDTPEAKKALQERPEADGTSPVRAYLEALFETWDTRPEPRFWRDVIDRNRVAAVELAKTHGKEIVPVLRKYGSVGESQILAFLTLDQLQFHEEAVELASLWFVADSSSGNVLLSASLCSEPTRIAIANGLLKRWTKEGRSPPGSPKSFTGFLAVVGNAETAGLLRAYDRKIAERATAAGKESGTKPAEESPAREPREATSKSIFLQAAEHITARLALPTEAAAQQARAELSIWQIAECAPHPVWGDSYRSLMRPYTGEGPSIFVGLSDRIFRKQGRNDIIRPGCRDRDRPRPAQVCNHSRHGRACQTRTQIPRTGRKGVKADWFTGGEEGLAGD